MRRLSVSGVVTPHHGREPRFVARVVVVLWLLVVPLAGLAMVATPQVARASSLPAIDLTVSHGLVNQSQTHPWWGDLPIGPGGTTIMGKCGCLLSALSTVVTYHLGDGSPVSSGSLPWFQVQHNQLVIDAADPTIPHMGTTRKGPLVPTWSFSPIYIDQYLQHGNLQDPYPPNWGYKSGFAGGVCGGQIHLDALETVAIPRVVTDESGNVVTSTPSGVRLQRYSGFGSDVRDMIDRNLLAAKPTIVGIRNPQSNEAHAYVVVGWDPGMQQYKVVDPAAEIYKPSHFPSAAPPGSSGLTYEGWVQQVDDVFDVQPVYHTGAAPLSLRIDDDPAPFELLSINPDGLRSGYDPATGLDLREDVSVNVYSQPMASDITGVIPPAPAEQMLAVRAPRSGAYRFIATATGDGELVLNFTTVTGHVLTQVGRVEQPITRGQIVKIEAVSTGTAVQSVTQVENFTPEARAGGDTGGAVGADIVFDGSRSFDVDGSITSHAWDFGDGVMGTGERPSHAYAAPGIYTVTLTVSDDHGATAMATTRAVVGRPAPARMALVSVSSLGEPGLTQGSFRPSISGDGRYVAFDSGAWNLVGGDTNARGDVFVRDHLAGVTTRVGVSTAGAQANDVSFDPAISADGWHVAFTSNASNLVSGDTNARGDVFVHDRQSGTTERVSVASSGAQAGGASSAPAISADGRYVAFESVAANLVPGDTNGAVDVFIHDRATGTTERVSVDASGAEGGRDSPDAVPHSTAPSVSADGRLVVFESWARLVEDDDNGRADVYLRDRVNGTTTRLSQADGGTLPVISGDGAGVAYVVDASERVVVFHDLRDGTTEIVGPDGAPQHPNPGDGLAISRDGRFVAFAARGDVLPGDDGVEAAHVYLRDRQTGELERISVGESGEVMTSGQMKFVAPAISDDGRFVAFGQGSADPRYRDTSLTPDDANNQYDVFIRDRQEPEPSRPVAVPSGPYIAWASGDAVPTSVTLDASGSVALNDLPLRARWDFGDGSPPVEIDDLTVGHSYAQPGIYTVTLTVLDDLAESEPMTTTVEVLPALPAQARLDATPSCVNPGATIVISGYSAASSNGTYGGAAVDDLIRDGWNLAGDSLTIEPAEVLLPWLDEPLVVERRLPDLLFRAVAPVPAGLAPGAYEIESSGADPTTVTLPCPPITNLPPSAHAGGPEYSATTGVPIVLDGVGSTDPEGAELSYHWDYGDGNHEAIDTPQATHAFGYPGVYIVSLTVNDGQLDSPLGPGTGSYAVVTVTGEMPTDATPPTATATVSPAANDAGWHASDAVVDIAAADEEGGSGIKEVVVGLSGAQTGSSVIPGASASAPVTAEGETTVTWFARDNAGNASTAASLIVRIDRTSPVVAFEGNAGVYDVDEMIAITCSASDSLSGLASDTCVEINALAATLGPGSHTITANAIDNAGNASVGTATFEVTVTYDGLCALTRSWVGAAGLTPIHAKLLGASLCAKLWAAEAAGAQGNNRAKAALIRVYINQVRVLTPSVFTAEQRDILVDLAGAI